MSGVSPIVTRFAPSPNGPLHLGHAYSAIVAHDLAKESGGAFLLRIEDIDGPRSKPEFADAFRRDLEWLGLEWDEVPAQSSRLIQYEQAANDLRTQGLLYPCSCTRKELAALPDRIAEDGTRYPGQCHHAFEARKATGADGDLAWRINIDAARAAVGALTWEDAHAGETTADPRAFGDVVIVRKDLPASYHLAVTHDDAQDGVTLVTRGMDLFASTHIHRVLQALLNLPVPRWYHHPLILDDRGEKLAKRKGSPALGERRKSGEDGLAIADRLRATQI